MKKFATLFSPIFLCIWLSTVGAQPVLTEIKFLVNGLEVDTTSFEDIRVELIFDSDMDQTISPLVKFGLSDPYPLTVSAGQGWISSTLWQGLFTVSNSNPQTGDGEYIFEVSGAKDLFNTEMDTTLSTTLNKTLFICRGGELRLTSTSIDFGTITAGSSQTMSVTISDTSCADLTVSDINFSPSSPFSLINLAVPFTIAGGGSQELTIRFSPTTRQDYSATMTIESDDRLQSSHTVQLDGSAKGSKIQLLPISQLSFGKVEVGEDSTRTVTVSNPKATDGSLSDTLHVTNIFTGSSVFTLSTTTLTIPPDSSKTVDVTFTPTQRITYNQTLQLQSDDLVTPIKTISLFGNASDESGPPPLTGLQPVWNGSDGYTNSSFLNICWDNPSDPSGIGAIWFYFTTSSVPPISEPDSTQNTSTSVAGRIAIQLNANCAALPLFGRISSGFWYCYLWLEDGNGNRSWANRVQTTFIYDVNAPGIPTIASRTIPELDWFGANEVYKLTINIPADLSRGTRDAVEVFWKFQSPPTSTSDYHGNSQFNPPIGEQELFTVAFDSENYCGDDSLYFWLADSTGNVDENNYAAVRYRFDICPPEITRILSDIQNIANLGETFLDTLTITDDRGVDTAWVRYRFGGAESEEPPRQLTQIEGTDNYVVDIPEAGVTRRGIEYQVVAFDGLNNQANGPTTSSCDTDSAWFPVRTRVEGEGDFRLDSDGRPVPLIFGEDEANYQLFSVPYDLDSSSVMQVLQDDLGQYDQKQWRFFDYKTDNQESSRFLEGTDARSFQPGRSYFIITRQENIVVDSGPGQTRRTVCNDTIQVYEGWNLIATPFNFPVNKESLSLINSNSIITLRSFEGGWNITDVMEPWKGYAFFVTSDGGNDDMYLVVQPKAAPGRVSKSAAEPLTLDRGDWAVQISGRVGNVHDLENWAGIRNLAQPGFDDLELAEPPVIGKFLKISFLHPDWNLPTNEFSTDFRPSAVSEQVWEFEVNTNAVYSEVNLSFNFLGDFPNAAEVHLIDETLQSAQNLRANPRYLLKSGQDGLVRKLKLIVGGREFASQQAGNIALIPEKFDLLQNFPNPFNPETSIRYNLPEASRVAVSIYDLLGRRVRTLINNEQKEAGYFTTRWNGLDDAGRQVATGVYIYQLKTKSKTISRKMILMK